MRQFIRSPEFSNLVILLVISLLVIFLGPYLNIGGNNILAGGGIRTLIVGLLAGTFVLRLFVGRFRSYGMQLFPMMWSKLRLLGPALTTLFSRLGISLRTQGGNLRNRFSRDKQNWQLRRLPWYLVLGTPNAGKKTTIANSGLHFNAPEKFGTEAQDYINQFPDYEWWFTDQAVLVDTMKYDEETDLDAWKNFVKLLRRKRKYRPINGVIINVALPDLLMMNNQDRQAYIQSICLYIREIHSTFKAQVPIYLIFTKCDLVDGFTQFFNDLSKEELAQVWGMTLPLQECSELNSVKTLFNREFSDLINRLQKRVLWSLDSERTLRGRQLIQCFPEQMQLFRRPLETFICELFGATRYIHALQFRGVYFTSAMQSGEPIDFLLAAIAKKYQMARPITGNSQAMSESYFIYRLFHEVIFAESKTMGLSERAIKIRKWGYNALRISAPLFLLASTIGMYNAYYANLKNISVATKDVAAYEQSILTTSSSSRLLVKDTLPALNALNHALSTYNSDQTPWAMNLLYESHSIRNSIDAALRRTLATVYLPRIAANLEERLGKDVINQNLLYAILKGYLAFSLTDHAEANALIAPMEYEWSKEFRQGSSYRGQLRYYLNMALEGRVVTLPVDTNLINRVRAKLERIVPAQRAYGLLLLRARVSNLPDIVFASKIGPSFSQTFSLDSKDRAIPALFTQAGLDSIYAKQSPAIVEQVSEDNQAVGLSDGSERTESEAQIGNEMRALYTRDYQRRWFSVLQNIKVKPFHNLNQAVDTLNRLSKDDSSLAKLLSIVYKNTNDARSGSFNVSNAFIKINNFNTNKMSDVQSTLAQLRDYMNKLGQSANPDQAEFNAAKDYMKGDLKNPLHALSAEAKSAPEPIRSWLLGISNNSWQVIASGARRYMNAAWDNQVYSEYNAGLRGKFPLSSQASAQVSIEDFSHFFGPKGTMASFFNKYLKPFVNTSKRPWALFSLNGHNLGLSASELRTLESAADIQKHYFANGATTPHLSFSIKPRTLSKNAASIEFNVGNRSISYSHGPQNSAQFSWPISRSEQGAKVFITDFAGNHYTRAYSGPWAFFKLINQHISGSSTNGRYTFSINLSGHYASYSIAMTGGIGVLRLSQIKAFSLPKQL